MIVPWEHKHKHNLYINIQYVLFRNINIIAKNGESSGYIKLLKKNFKYDPRVSVLKKVSNTQKVFKMEKSFHG